MDTEQEDKKIIREEPPEHNAPVLDEGQELAIPVSLYREEYIRFSETVFRLPEPPAQDVAVPAGFPAFGGMYRSAAD